MSAPNTRTLPSSIDSEMGLLCLCFMDGAEMMAKCIMGGVKTANFYEPKHQVIFDTMTDLYAANKPLTVSVVAEELKTRRRLEEAGDFNYLTQLSGAVPTTAEAAFYIEKVCETATLREVIRACQSAVEECYDFTGGLDELSSQIGDRITKALGQGAESEETIQVVAGALEHELSLPEAQRPKPVGEVSWGLVDVDAKCGKMQAGNLVILAGMPSTGKSALADAIAWKNALAGKADGHETVLFTYEMTKREKAIRIAQQNSRLNYDQVNLAPPDMRRGFMKELRAIQDCKTLHVFERDITVQRVLARCRSFVTRGKKVGLVVVDFLQYFARLEATIGRERTDEKIGRITSALKQIARECDCPTLLLSSINREGYKDGNRPTMGNLKGSGEIDSDADAIAILHWPKVNPMTNEEQDPHDGYQSAFYVEFNQDKGRHKGVQQVGLSFERPITRFSNFIR